MLPPPSSSPSRRRPPPAWRAPARPRSPPAQPRRKLSRPGRAPAPPAARQGPAARVLRGSEHPRCAAGDGEGGAGRRHRGSARRGAPGRGGEGRGGERFCFLALGGRPRQVPCDPAERRGRPGGARLSFRPAAAAARGCWHCRCRWRERGSEAGLPRATRGGRLCRAALRAARGRFRRTQGPRSGAGGREWRARPVPCWPLPASAALRRGVFPPVLGET